jgi:hypothetical protein
MVDLQEEDQITQVTDPSAGLHEQDLHDLAKTTQEGGTVVPPRSVHQTHNWPLRLNNTAIFPS